MSTRRVPSFRRPTPAVDAPATSWSPQTGSARTKVYFERAAAVTAGVVFLFFCWRYRNSFIDDPYINLRYAKNILSGNGPVFNRGERVEGFSSPLGLAVAVVEQLVTQATGWPAITIARIFGVVVGLLTIRATRRLAADLFGASLAGTMAAAVLACSPSFSYWCVGGLETPYLTLAIVWMGQCLIRDGMERLSWSSALVAAALLWIRPDTLLPIGVLYGFWVLRVASGRLAPQALTKLAVGAGLIVGLFGARYALYGAIVPNTYYAKTAQGPLWLLREGTAYTYAWLAGHTPTDYLFMEPLIRLAYPQGLALLCIAAFGALQAPREVRHRAALVTAVTVALLAATTVEGGDWMPGFRFIVPSLPFLCTLAGGGLHHLFARLATRPTAAYACVVGLAAAASAPGIADRNITDSEPPLSRPEYTEVASWISRNIPQRCVIASGEMGLIPYVTENPYVDMFGLLDKVVAKTPITPLCKDDVASCPKGAVIPPLWLYRTPTDYVLSRDPDYFLLAGDGSPFPFRPHWRFLFAHAEHVYRDHRFQEKYRELTLPPSAVGRHSFAVFCRTGTHGDCRCQGQSQAPR